MARGRFTALELHALKAVYASSRAIVSWRIAEMTVFVALLRAVNVGGTGMLPMKVLAGMCADLGFDNVRTYIQSGNVVFRSRLSGQRVQASLEKVLAAHMGKKIDVIVRDAADLRRVLEANPFPDAEPAKVAVAFCSAPVQKKVFDAVVAPGGEQIVAGREEVYIYYPDGMGRSKLKFPKTEGFATVRNINTVSRLVIMTEET
jgi:uncharacterized protein (DUF1697 family)